MRHIGRFIALSVVRLRRAGAALLVGRRVTPAGLDRSCHQREEVQPDDFQVPERRIVAFERLHAELAPALVDFVERMGIRPANEVLNHAVQYSPYIASRLREMLVKDEDDRLWLLARMAYFVGEYFAQKYEGCWYVNEIPGSRYFAKYVVGRFSRLSGLAAMIDPFEIARTYVDTDVPRDLVALLREVEEELEAL